MSLCYIWYECGWWWKAGGSGAAGTMADLCWPHQPPFTFVVPMMLRACVTVWIPPGMKIPHVAHHTCLTLAVITAHPGPKGGVHTRNHRHTGTAKAVFFFLRREKLISTLAVLQGDTHQRGWANKHVLPELWGNVFGALYAAGLLTRGLAGGDVSGLPQAT